MKAKSAKRKAQNIKAEIINNKSIAKDVYKMTLSAAAIAKSAKPGQFVMVRCSDAFQPLLRRPLSLHSTKDSDIEVLYEVIGEGTKILSLKKPGEYVDIIGPLGNGFDYTLYAKRYPLSILIAGGIGIAPLLFLAQKLSDQKPVVLIGAKTKSEILCEKEFKKLGCEVKIATDNGSRGHKGFITDLLKNLLSTIDYRLSTIYACGPKPMLKEISKIAKEYKIPCQISLEEHMACGIGACLGCIVNTKQGYKRACKEGPVFNAEDIVW